MLHLSPALGEHVYTSLYAPVVFSLSVAEGVEMPVDSAQVWTSMPTHSRSPSLIPDVASLDVNSAFQVDDRRSSLGALGSTQMCVIVFVTRTFPAAHIFLPPPSVPPCCLSLYAFSHTLSNLLSAQPHQLVQQLARYFTVLSAAKRGFPGVVDPAAIFWFWRAPGPLIFERVVSFRISDK